MPGYINSMNTPDELLQAYTTLLLFLGGSVSMAPEESGLPQLCDNGLLRNLPVESHNDHFMQASCLLKSPCPFKQQCYLTVGNNYHSLMKGKTGSTAYPAATHWIKKGTTKDEYYQDLVQHYRRYGYQKDNECHLEADHLGIQLLFINLLIEKYLTEDDSEIKEMIRKDLLSFINDEMLTWLPRWAEKVRGNSVTKCYTGISGLVIGSLEDVRDILKDQKLGL